MGMTRISVAWCQLFAASVICGGVVGAATAGPAFEIDWQRQIGSPYDDSGYSVAVDKLGNAYVSGGTLGIVGALNKGMSDVFLLKYDATGNVVWKKQYGTSFNEYGWAVAADLVGNVYVAGHTSGSFVSANAGGDDAFLMKFAGSGEVLWRKQFGTPQRDIGFSVTVDRYGNPYVAGQTDGNFSGYRTGQQDAFVAKYFASGTASWTRAYADSPSVTEYGRDVAVDTAGNVYITGYTRGRVQDGESTNEDAFLVKYNPAGTLLWKRPIVKGGRDVSYSVATDAAGNVYIGGYEAQGYPNGSIGGSDAMLAKYDGTGTLLWAATLRADNYAVTRAVAVSGDGDIYVVGDTLGNVGGPNAGGVDTYVARYSTDGALLGAAQIGTPKDEFSSSIAVDAAGSVWIAGYTEGDLGGQNTGGLDVYLVKLTPIVPEPAASGLMCVGGVILLRRRRNFR